MYSLKREAMQYRLYPPRFPVPVLAQEFYKMVRQRGRSSEFWLVLRMALRTNPLMLLGMIRSGWDLLRTGRLSLRRDRIRDIHSLPGDLAPREVA